MMKKYINYMALAFIMGIMPVACSNEESLEPSGVNDNFFKVADDAQDAESVLRRNFYNDNGIYLLFNDTLRKELVGQNAYGEDVWKVETVDLQYNMTSYGVYSLHFDYMTSLSDKQKAATLVKEYVLPHLSGGMRPYSILLLDGLATLDSYDELQPTPCYTNMRCMAIAAGEWVNMNAEEQEAYRREICKTLVSGKCSSTDEAFDAFYAISDKYYGEYISDIFSGWDRNMEYVYECGFLDYKKDSWGEIEYDYFYYESTDFTSFYNAVMDMTEEDFLALYSDYPLIMQKYYAMRNAIIELGYIF